ncbi:MAG: glutamate--tRNA ligase [Patescibacteria group bacterium]|nr:MAG: glutamate--tRNA ligase [Patescibacteria group bacterium]
MSKVQVRTRIAPSPTGQEMHIGNLYTALINFVWAKKNKGRFIVRIEDTDRTRYVPGSEQRLLQNLKDFGLFYDEGPDVGGEFGPYVQSQRLSLYKKYAFELVEQDFAYLCFCSQQRLSELRQKQQEQKIMPPKYDRFCLKTYSKQQALELYKSGKPAVVRLKVPEDQVIDFVDEIRGKISFDSNLIDDQVLLKSDGYPTYHLAVVVDDYLMKINYVIRAEEWISSTPKQILLYRAFNWPVPKFVHLPVLRNPDRSKLSKRKNPVWVSWYLQEGFLPEAVLNYLSLMGFSHPEGKEIFSLKELIKVFDIKRINPVGPVFDLVKLEWLNGEYIRSMPDSVLKDKIILYYKNFKDKQLDQSLVAKTIPLIKERIKKLSDYWFYCSFFWQRPDNYQLDLKSYKDLILKMLSRLTDLSEWTADNIGNEMTNLAKQEGLSIGKFFMILRVAITGQKITPPLNESMEILGKDECLERLRLVV